MNYEKHELEIVEFATTDAIVCDMSGFDSGSSVWSWRGGASVASVDEDEFSDQ